MSWSNITNQQSATNSDMERAHQLRALNPFGIDTSKPLTGEQQQKIRNWMLTEVQKNNGSYEKALQSVKSAPQQASTQVQPAKPELIKAGPQSGLRSVGTQIKYDEQGRPIKNDYLSVTDSAGNLSSQYSLANQIGQGINLNTQGIDEIRKRAMATGPSAWATLAQEKQNLDEQTARQGAQRSNLQSQNQAYSSLASRGGISAGQRERLAMQTMRNNMRDQQGIRNQGMQARYGIGLQDQQMKDQFLNQLPGLDMNVANFQQSQRAYADNAKATDIQRALQDAAGLNAYNSGAYSEAMREWGAAKTADAQARSSGGGGKK